MQAFHYGWQNFKRNLWLSGAVIIILVLLFFCFSFLISLNLLVQETVNNIRAKADLSIYLTPNVTDNSLNSLKNDLESLDEIQKIDVVNSQQALSDFKERHKDNPAIIKSLQEINTNPFGPTLLIKIKPETDISPVLSLIASPRYQDIVLEKDFSNYQQLINKIDFWGHKIKFLGFLISGLFVAIVVLMIFNAIRLSIYARLEEIKMMRLVGATASSIQTPFLFEILISIVIATLISDGLFLLLTTNLQSQLASFLGFNFNLVHYALLHGLSFFGGPFVFTVIICWLAASAAMKKYLNL